jgi:thymidylate synthase
LLKLTNPRARLSHTERKGKVFSGLGELLWYLAKSNDLEFISYYIEQYRKESEDGATVYGAYGPRLFGLRGNDQFERVLDLLGRKPGSRRAVIQLFDADDLRGQRKEIPCTCTLQFMVRGGRLELVAAMRSNDAFKGLPHDVFSFTMIQEILARILGHEPGAYTHFVGSLHLYEYNLWAARQYLDEGWQPTLNVAMPPMPAGDPRPSIETVLQAEAAIREGRGLAWIPMEAKLGNNHSCNPQKKGVNYRHFLHLSR